MADVLVATSARLAKTTAASVRNAGQYMVDHSEEMQHDVREIWQCLQTDRLHKDHRVRLANLQATRIVSDPTPYFAGPRPT